MEEKKIDRINELARKAKNEGLSEAEKAEQQMLRKEYLAAIRASMTSVLENTYIVDETGKHKLQKKDHQ